ncbi:MAG: 16S rRNA (uracil(1498)-N(3))-methyltransferase [Deltaproteobacteria bacterium]|nr:16S rRNA (uracil(1498)-N(3))-methyltransferase [Deltaproteobacteria bacterium]MBT4089251.1 16S rRNA (uracil(1498)-N(3))-methyltransferase [Deltaproteobacteria bacterium]MBT4264040.1 16S rRNA (uracil(1498)-N(3))-methyltransferase [Deltaproteobacteria bacterium]MBT4640640.1 16S rRNA (uracil(1498)-N(3))-methyltransferase [Deltaproteobacteria bacterium]MBT6505067.1 16S rRNA (uracil(1498)-N(3))-methyltransferase [Deltaproteobacteria bacterium]
MTNEILLIEKRKCETFLSAFQCKYRSSFRPVSTALAFIFNPKLLSKGLASVYAPFGRDRGGYYKSFSRQLKTFNQNEPRVAVSYFLFSDEIQTGQCIAIKGDEASHILNSRRIQIGEVIQIQDQKMLRYEARVEKMTHKSLTLLPFKNLKTPPESQLRIHLYQALVKEKALDAIIQKCTELGVCSICFFQSRYSQRLQPKTGLEKKRQRWLRIAVEACKQSGRVAPPNITFISDLSKFHQVSVESSIETIPSFCLESSGETVSMDSILTNDREINLIVGPEGGWGPGDLSEQNFRCVHLGPRILRSETASIAAVSILQFLYGDMKSAPRY